VRRPASRGSGTSEEIEMDAKKVVMTVRRRKAWLFGKLGPAKLANLATATKDFALKRETTRSLPAMVKIDISPVCNLRCTACVHAEPQGNEILEKQAFAPSHRMDLEQFAKLIDQIRGKATSVSLYYLGDPYAHPQVDEMCRIAADANLEVHCSSNFSFGFKDERIRSIVESGLTHLTVCIDGLSQEKYQRTRVGGNIKRVIDNLERVAKHRKQIGSKYPLIEVQYIKFQHNLDEMEEARRLCERVGVDQFSSFWGDLHNWTDRDPGQYEVLGPLRDKRLPHCYWPWFSTVIKWNGDVIPCCTHRQGTQYAPGEDPRVFGNVFEKPLAEIWNSVPYQQARRLSASPAASDADPKLKGHFCDACPALFETDRASTGRWASEHVFEEFYEVDERGRTRRKDAAAGS
jgi:MoaA/NifB/PqqE/SkfB family radical SAM enzyme